ncbi:MAG: DUF4923 family protein [Phocaeicola sp.]|nr:DUF4923 family protein [Phocaeicola sp.]
MKKIICICMILLTGTLGCMAQDWKDIVSGVVNTVVGNQASQQSLVGTWKYVSPDCKFESDNLIAKAGSELAAKKVEEKMSSIFQQIGMTEGCTFVFNADSTYTSTVGTRTVKGTYTYNKDTQELLLKTSLGVKITTTATLSGKKLSILFKSDKLLSVVQGISNVASKVNSSLETVSKLAGQYDGLNLGFMLEKQ